MAKPTKVSLDYASGISQPFRGDSDGGVALAEGEEYIRQQVLATMMPNGSDNPFQDLGIGEEAIFQNPASPDWKLAIRQRITRQMALLERENLARLLKVRFDRVKPSGDLSVVVSYTNLETTQAGQAVALVGRESPSNLRAV